MKFIDFFFKTSKESFIVGHIYVTYLQPLYSIFDWLIFPVVVSVITDQKSLKLNRCACYLLKLSACQFLDLNRLKGMSQCDKRHPSAPGRWGSEEVRGREARITSMLPLFCYH